MILNSDFKTQIVLASSQIKTYYVYYVLYITYKKPDKGLQWGPKHVAVLIKIKV